MPEATTVEAPASAVIPETKTGDTPSATPAKAETQSKLEQARAALKGEPPKDAERDMSEEASIDALFDPETGQLLDLQPEETGDTPSDEAVETEEQKAEREEQEEKEREAVEAKKGEPKRIRINRDNMNDRDFAIIRLMDDQGISYHEAEKRLYGDTQPKPKEQEQEQEQPTAKKPTVAELEAKIKEAEDALEKSSDAMDVRESIKLTREIARLERLVERTKDESANRQQTAEQIAAQKYAETETASLTKIIERYADANTVGTPLFEAIQTRAAELRKDDPAFFHRPSWPVTLVTEVATDLGIAPALKGAPAKTETPAIVAPKKPTRPAGTPAPGTATSATTIQNMEATLRAELKAAKTPDEVKAVMRKIDAMGKK